jgi:DNA-binding NtrC family response regulator
METLPNKKRACVLLVDHDLAYGITLADWLAAHGYQAVLVRSMETAIDECRDLRPQAVFIGLSPSDPVATFTLRRLFHIIEMTCPRAPVVTMRAWTGRGQTDIPNGGSLRHIHLPIKPFEFTYVGRLLQSELIAAAASPTSQHTGSGPPDSCAVGNRPRVSAAHREAAPWIS